jgi:Leucine-rich repeat (LRR) protein
MLLLGTRRPFLQKQQLLLLLSTIPIILSSAAGGGGDEAALMAFKGKISSRSSSLASWNESTSYCSWEGVTCSQRHRLRVVALDLSSRGLTGTISPDIGNLTFLRSLNLSFNSLQGEIPPSIGSLGRLQILDLTQNMLTGGIPGNISRCTSLRVMVIGSNNGLQGSIPDEIGNMPSLGMLGLFENSITGTIPPSFGNLSQLTKLSLKGNYLEGNIPAGIGNNPHLRFINLAINNLSGLLPPSMYNLSSLNTLSMAQNELHGHPPADLEKGLPSIQQFGIAKNRFAGHFPLSLTNLSSLQLLDVGFNNFTGFVPSQIGRLRNLNVLFLGNNLFEANNEKEWEFISSLTNCSRLQMLSIEQNRFAGKLPSSVANLTTNLQLLRIHTNYISGVIPSDIGNLAGLEEIGVTSNLFTGVIPESIGKLRRLNQVYLNSNNLSGLIPFSIGNLTGLSILNANDNNLAGPIPPSIGNLTKNLVFLALSGNKLTGMIPNEIMELSSISIALDLSYNFLEGPLPPEVGNLVNIKELRLSGNRLSGEIPDTIGNCRVLEILSMDGNSFQGSIPATFKNMAGLTLLNLTGNQLNGSIPGNIASITNLMELYLSHNNLSGTIPGLLGNSTSLLLLDLSFNNLQGEVPTEGVFRNLSGLSIIGNNALCGGIPQLHLPKCTKSTVGEKNKSTLKFLRIVISITGAILFLLSGLALAGFCYRKSKVGLMKDEQPTLIEIDLPMVSYNDILKGTDGFSEANVLGKGRYGTVYRGTLENHAVAVAVKVFNLQQSGSYKSFMAECEALRRVRHRCLLKIITCCSSINHQGQDFRAIVFEFMANGSLDGWIYSNFDGQNGPRALSLSQRLDIAVDIVDALDYLHNGCQPPVIHCDLKPSNILLNQDMRAHVGDFGIARILDEATSQQPINSNSSIGIRGSIGYIAPGNSDMLLCASQNSIYLALCKCNTFLKILHMPHMLYIVSLCCRIWRRACSINLW